LTIEVSVVGGEPIASPLAKQRQQKIVEVYLLLRCFFKTVI
jgi:hypothetical protein